MSYILTDIYSYHSGSWESSNYFPVHKLAITNTEPLGYGLRLGSGGKYAGVGMHDDGLRFIIYNNLTNTRTEVSFPVLKEMVLNGELDFVTPSTVRDELLVSIISDIGYKFSKCLKLVDIKQKKFGEQIHHIRLDINGFPIISIPKSLDISSNDFSVTAYDWSANRIGVIASGVFVYDYIAYLFKTFPDYSRSYFFELTDSHIILHGIAFDKDYKLCQCGDIIFEITDKDFLKLLSLLRISWYCQSRR